MRRWSRIRFGLAVLVVAVFGLHLSFGNLRTARQMERFQVEGLAHSAEFEAMLARDISGAYFGLAVMGGAAIAGIVAIVGGIRKARAAKRADAPRACE